MRLSHDRCVGVNVKVKRPTGCAASQLVVSRETWGAFHVYKLFFTCNITGGAPRPGPRPARSRSLPWTSCRAIYLSGGCNVTRLSACSSIG
jgi:hypothetical protein